MSYSVEIPLDDDGFLRRECPACERYFKWHDGSTADRPQDAIDPLHYTCPYCGELADGDSWWTTEQLEFATASAIDPIMEDVAADFNREQRSHRNDFLRLSMTPGPHDPPSALHEPSDMVAVASPCHPWEPVKIAEEWTEPLHCLICGAPYSVG